MKRRVKYFKRVKNGKVYRQPWVGYSQRTAKGTPDFKREFSLAGWSEKEVQAIDRVLRQGHAPEASGKIEFLEALPIGGPWTAYWIAEDLGLIAELNRFEEKHRQALLAMIVDRVVEALPHSKLGLWESLRGSGLERVIGGDPMSFGLHDFYIALEKLYEQQSDIQKSLFGRRETVDQMFLYDITSSYFEGKECELAAWGYNRDGKKGKLQIVIGLLSDSNGRPLAVEVFEGNTSDQTTVLQQIDYLQKQLGVRELIFVGDRGMLTKARRTDLQAKEYNGVRYISALSRTEFFQFLEDQSHPLQLTLFDREKLVEVECEGVRYILSFNPEKELDDRTTRQDLIAKTRDKLQHIQQNVQKGKWRRPEVIAKHLHRWLNHWGMERFFTYEYAEGQFTFQIDSERVKAYETIDGFYVLTTDVLSDHLSTTEVRERYKSLAQVEQAFRTMKTTDLFIRPIRLWNAQRVKGHVFLCMLAYLIVWKARTLFSDFLSDHPVAEKDQPGKNCHSLRVLWEQLDRWVQIGRFRMGSTFREQLNTVPAEAKPILRAANAMPNKENLAQIKLVG